MKYLFNKNKTTTILTLFLLTLFSILSLGFSSAKYGIVNQNVHLYSGLITQDSSDVDDCDDLNITIEKLNDKLKQLEGIKVSVNIDKDKLKEKLKRIRIHSIIDQEKINEFVENLKEELEDNPIDIDFNFETLNESLEKMKENLEDMEIDLSNLKVEMKKLKSFLKEMKSELIKDGYIDNSDEDYDLEFTKDEIIVNGEKLPDELLDKYKNIYEKHFGREITDTFRLKNKR